MSEKGVCYICGQPFTQDEQAFILQRGKVNNICGDRVYVHKNGGAKFFAHAACENEVLWHHFNPDLDLDKEYYSHIVMGWKEKKRVWRLGKRVIKENSTQQEINDLIALFAKDLLSGKA